MAARGENKKKLLRSTYRGAETNSQREIPPEFRAACDLTMDNQPVPVDTAPDELDGNTIIASQVEINEVGQAFKRTTKKKSGSIVLHDQQYDETINLIYPNTRTMQTAGTGLGQPGTQVKDLGNKQEIADGVDISAFTTFANTFLLSFSKMSPLRVPDVLTGIDVLFVEDSVNGVGSEGPLFTSFAGQRSITIPCQSRVQGSSIKTAKAIPHIIPLSGTERKTTSYVFLMPMPVTAAAVVTKLQTLTGLTVVWPSFSPRHVQIIITTRRVSLQCSANITGHQYDTGSGGGIGQIDTGGTSYSKEISMTIEEITLPPTIHADLSGVITFGRFNAPVTTVHAHVDEPFGLLGFAAVAPKDISLTEQGWVQLDYYDVGATPGTTALPNTGLIVVAVEAQIYKFGYAMYHVETLDASTI